MTVAVRSRYNCHTLRNRTCTNGITLAHALRLFRRVGLPTGTVPSIVRGRRSGVQVLVKKSTKCRKLSVLKSRADPQTAVIFFYYRHNAMWDRRTDRRQTDVIRLPRNGQRNNMKRCAVNNYRIIDSSTVPAGPAKS